MAILFGNSTGERIAPALAFSATAGDSVDCGFCAASGLKWHFPDNNAVIDRDDDFQRFNTGF